MTKHVTHLQLDQAHVFMRVCMCRYSKPPASSHDMSSSDTTPEQDAASPRGRKKKQGLVASGTSTPDNAAAKTPPPKWAQPRDVPQAGPGARLSQDHPGRLGASWQQSEGGGGGGGTARLFHTLPGQVRQHTCLQR
jgi:hypothetical protein